MKLFHDFVQFFAKCLEALLDDDEASKRQQREAALRQKRWLNYLSSPTSSYTFLHKTAHDQPAGSAAGPKVTQQGLGSSEVSAGQEMKLCSWAKSGAAAVINRSVLLAPLIVVLAGSWPIGADAWIRPYRPEYEFGWGYLPPFGLGFNWRYPYIVDDENGADYGPPPSMTAFCAQPYRTYDPITQTYLGYDGRRHRCP